MTSFRPRASLRTHDVTNQVPPLQDYSLYAIDTPMQEALVREGAGWAQDRVAAFGELLGTEPMIEAGRLANRHKPELRIFDRSGHRVDEVDFHPAYHQIFAAGVEHGVSHAAWTCGRPGGHVLHVAQEYQLSQIEAGVCCPLTMTYAVVPALAHQPDLAEVWTPRATSEVYDPRMIPPDQKNGCTFGMAMTEKQGGSDVRANTTRAEPDATPGPGQPYRLTGHKWFCSAPMSDAFLTLAHTPKGLSCFLVPRWLPDHTRNPFFIQRLKDKLGNRSNASSEIEYDGTWGWLVGDEGRGVRNILEMVHHTRLDCTIAAAGLMRSALTQALHHAQHRRAFGGLLIEQPLMRNVLADLALEVEATTAMAFRVARAYDEASASPGEAILARVAVAVSKYWVNKRCPGMIVESMECLGGAGYVEESDLPRLYREAPLNGIWEGSGNVICLDVLRAAGREPESLPRLLAEISTAAGQNTHLDATIAWLKAQLRDQDHLQYRARHLVERLAMALQASLLVRHAPSAVSDAFCAGRLGPDAGVAYGTLPRGTDTSAILGRAWAGAAL